MSSTATHPASSKPAIRFAPGFWLGVALVSGGVFFIRGDWPFGFDGAYLTIVGLMVLTACFVAQIGLTGVVPRVGRLVALFTSWAIASIFILLINSWFQTSPDMHIRVAVEILFNLALFFGGYLIVRFAGLDVHTVLFVGSLWAFVAGYNVLEESLTYSSLHRLKTLASVNYMAASFGAFFVFAIGSFVWKLGYSKRTRIVFLLLCLVCGFALVVSYARSAILGTGIVLAFWALSSPASGSKRQIVKMNIVLILIAALMVSSIGWYLYSYQVNTSGISGRFTWDDINRVMQIRLFRHWQSSLPGDASQLLLGMPELYPLFLDFALHPHNILLSILRFTGLIPFLLFVMFGFSLAVRCFQVLRRWSGIHAEKVAVLTAMVFVIFVYSMVSGHFTRHWHVFWLLGLLCGSLELFTTTSGIDRDHRERYESPKTQSFLPHGGGSW